MEAANIDDNLKANIQSKINNTINKKQIYNKKEWKDKSIIKQIINKIQKDNLVITTEDKGSRFVILHKQEYEEKIKEDLEKQKYIIINKNPGKIIKAKYIKLLRNMKTYKLINEKEYRFLYPTAFEHPCVFGKVKTHKDNMPVRLVMDFNNYVFSGLCNIIYKKIADTVGFGKYCIKNSEEIVDKLSLVKLNRNSVMASFDIEKMYQSVPRNESIKIVISKIKEDSKLSDSWIKIIEEALGLINETLYFKYKMDFWKIEKGWIIGCQLVGLCHQLWLILLRKR